MKPITKQALMLGKILAKHAVKVLYIEFKGPL